MRTKHTTSAIEVRNIGRAFLVRSGLFAVPRTIVAVDDVSFSVPKGGVLGVVGESGCGKSTLARLILGLLAPTGGEALVAGKRLASLDRRTRARLIQPVFQDPFASLNPRRCIRDIVALPLLAQGSFSRGEIERRVAAMLDRVGLAPELGERLPASLSGGQRLALDERRARGRQHQAEDQARQRGLAAARFTDDAEHAARRHAEGDIVDGDHPLFARQQPGVHAKLAPQVRHLDRRTHALYGSPRAEGASRHT